MPLRIPRLADLPSPSYGQKLFLLATLPLLAAVALITLIVETQSRQLAAREIRALEAQLIEAKRDELKNYLTIARAAFFSIYGRAGPDDLQAQKEVTWILSAMTYGPDGYFFVFDYDGTNLVAPRQTALINRNWAGLTDRNDIPVTDELVRLARAGGGFHEFDWQKPSTGEPARMMAYVTGLQDWEWAIGTGVFIDDVLDTVAAARAEVADRIERTTLYILAITIVALLGVFASGLLITVRERRLADAKLKDLTQRIIDTQEEERGRVARELHDSISQILVSVRYALELARRRLNLGDARTGESLDKGIGALGGAIQEVRRISRDLRPGVLDDLGLGPALQALCDDFQARTGIEVDFETVVFRNRLDEDARIALYRIAQEALTNVERHAGASRVSVSVKGHRTGALLRIADDGQGLPPDRPKRREAEPGGLGLRNMAERVEQLGGTLRLVSSARGTVIEAQVPLTHMLPPERRSTKESA